uniref:coadhesin isoform X2 n=1 Tax=Ciona intestinalis TaxID=7719 RepID=UPI000EF4E941|nr:coadhesin isoform X2 [Ciona intestinalis]|eukprot:XP_026692405.1 coadhesin isoform X2 [Ciona intestinalis]
MHVIQLSLVLLFAATVSGNAFGLSEVLSFMRLRANAWPTPHSPPNSNGTRLQDNTTYSYTAWSNYTTCDKVCGGGLKTRSRRCLDDQGVSHHTTMCWQRSEPLTTQQLLRNYLRQTVESQTQPCNVRDCAVSEWSVWGECSQYCGGGWQNSTRTCLESDDQEQCNFQEIRRRSCNNGPCFQLTPWGAWGNCTRVCGAGFKHRSRQCVPNLAPNSPGYNHVEFIKNNLNSVLDSGVGNIVSPVGSVLSPNVIYALHYLQICTQQTTDTGFCNQVPCPSCPFNQQYFTCKPCNQECRRQTSVSNTLSIDLMRFFGSLTGCSNGCEAGCGCPVLTPHLGQDGRCYTFESQCPINQGIRIITNGARGQPFQVTIPPILNSHSTVFHYPTRTTTTTTPATTTTTPATTTTTTTAPSKPTCTPNVLIATRPGYIPCDCDGDLVVQACHALPDTSCPVICSVQTLSCPAISNVRKSECPTANNCDRDSMCAIGYLCCATSCGRQCVRGQLGK